MRITPVASSVDRSFASSNSQSGLSKSQRKMVTKTDVFAKNNNNDSSVSLEQTGFSDEASTARTDSILKRDSLQQKRSRDSSEFVGTFDELNGVVTTKIYKEMKKKGRLDPLEENRQHQVQSEVLACMMPEDAGMVYSDAQGQGSQTNYIIDYSTSERQKKAKSGDIFDFGNDSTTDQEVVPRQENNLIDPSLMELYTQDQRNNSENMGPNAQSAPQQYLGCNGQLAPIIERSIEYSEMCSSLGPISEARIGYEGSSNRLTSRFSGMNNIMSHGGDFKGSNQSKSQVSISRDGSLCRSSMSPEEPNFKFSKPESSNHLNEVTQCSNDLALLTSYTEGHPRTSEKTLFSSSFSNCNDSPQPLLSIGSSQEIKPSLFAVQERPTEEGPTNLTRQDSLADIEDDDELNAGLLHKIPVQKGETVIVVSRTMEENRVRKRRWMVLKVSVIMLLLTWLIWAIFFTPTE